MLPCLTLFHLSSDVSCCLCGQSQTKHLSLWGFPADTGDFFFFFGFLLLQLLVISLISLCSVALGMDPRALYMVSDFPTTELHLQPLKEVFLFLSFFFRISLLT